VTDLGPLSAFPDPGITIAQFEGKEIGVIRWKGRLRAFLNVCPHQLTPVCAGAVLPRIESSEPGQITASEGASLVCPRHRWEFDLDSGRGLSNRRMKLKSFKVWAEAGRVLIEDPSGARRDSRAQVRNEPAVG
jgi:nitrite reductase/ring-hydroxylating ferredoxin subunit